MLPRYGPSGPAGDAAEDGQCPERLIDGAYLWSLGHLSVPLHLWRALSRFGAWIEPALISIWQLLMETYAGRQGRLLDPGIIA